MLNPIEIISIENQSADFPIHSHETFCISLIRKGTEVLILNDKTLYTNAGNISITNPNEIHANPLLKKGHEISFDTIYITQDLVDQCLETDNVKFKHLQAFDKAQVKAFQTLALALSSPDVPYKDLVLNVFLQKLTQLDRNMKPQQKNNSMHWEKIIKYIELNLTNELSLDILANFMYLNKYHFAKQFKKIFDLSPMHFVLMKKCFAAKSQISSTSNLTKIAYLYNFSDQAHFSKTFKKFVGLSPRAYKKSLI